MEEVIGETDCQILLVFATRTFQHWFFLLFLAFAVKGLDFVPFTAIWL